MHGRAMTEPRPGFVAEREIRIEAPPQTVFPFLVDPDRMTSWMGTAAELDPRPGGVWHVSVVGGRAVARGEFVSVDPPRSVVFTFGWEGPDQPVPAGSSKVEITLVPDGGGTILRLVHTALPDAHAAEQHTHGWTHYLSRLAVAAAGGDPGRDPNLDAPAP